MCDQNSSSSNSSRTAILIPCFNEAITIKQVIADFLFAVPEAAIFVYDNNSIDQTVANARASGVVVRNEDRQGKGHVVRRMFRDISADVYILVDGDATYDASVAPRMVQCIQTEGYDLVSAVRVPKEGSAFPGGHRFGNRVLTQFTRLAFGNEIRDMLSGYKAFSRTFVDSFPVHSDGFDIETEITIHALELQLPIAHIETSYQERPIGSESKLNTYEDGFRILRQILSLLRHERPLLFFSLLGFISMILALFLGAPIVLHYFNTGLVPRLPTAVLTTGLVLEGLLCFATGLILDTVSRGRRESRMLAYLSSSRRRSDG